MSAWYTKIHKSFRDELKGYGKSYSEIEKGCDLMLKTLGKLYDKIDATEFVKAKNKLKPKTVEGCSFDHLKNMLNEKNV